MASRTGAQRCFAQLLRTRRARARVPAPRPPRALAQTRACALDARTRVLRNSKSSRQRVLAVGNRPRALARGPAASLGAPLCVFLAGPAVHLVVIRRARRLPWRNSFKSTAYFRVPVPVVLRVRRCRSGRAGRLRSRRSARGAGPARCVAARAAPVTLRPCFGLRFLASGRFPRLSARSARPRDARFLLFRDARRARDRLVTERATYQLFGGTPVNCRRTGVGPGRRATRARNFRVVGVGLRSIAKTLLTESVGHGMSPGNVQFIGRLPENLPKIATNMTDMLLWSRMTMSAQARFNPLSVIRLTTDPASGQHGQSPLGFPPHCQCGSRFWRRRKRREWKPERMCPGW